MTVYVLQKWFIGDWADEFSHPKKQVVLAKYKEFEDYYKVYKPYRVIKRVEKELNNNTPSNIIR